MLFLHKNSALNLLRYVAPCGILNPLNLQMFCSACQSFNLSGSSHA